MSGDLTLFTPGSTVDARLVADGNGDVAGRGDAVEIVGESRDGTPEVALSSGGSATIGHLAAEPADYDADAEYDADAVVGEVGVNVRHYIDWFETDDGTLTAGDMAEWAAGGGVQTADTGSEVGPVFRTVARGEYRAGKVAVVRHR